MTTEPPSSQFIRYVAAQLDRHGVPPTDSRIVERIREMTTAEIIELAKTGKIEMWEPIKP